MAKFIKVICIQYSEFQNKLCKENTVTLLKDFLEEVDLSLSCLLSLFFKDVFHGDKRQKFCYIKASYFIALHICGNQLPRLMLQNSLLWAYRSNISICFLINKHSGIRQLLSVPLGKPEVRKKMI